MQAVRNAGVKRYNVSTRQDVTAPVFSRLSKAEIMKVMEKVDFTGVFDSITDNEQQRKLMENAQKNIFSIWAKIFKLFTAEHPEMKGDAFKNAARMVVTVMLNSQGNQLKLIDTAHLRKAHSL